MSQLSNGYTTGMVVVRILLLSLAVYPPPALLEASMSTADFHTYVDDMCEQIGDGHRWILGVSDNVPPDTDLSRLEYLGTRFTEVASG